MALSVKAYLERSGTEPEIRRLAIDEDVSTSFAYLEKKIAQVFPSLREGHFELYYKDSDADAVSISTDEELTVALATAVADGLFRVYIRTTSPSASATPLPSHPGVVCDGCEIPIVGNRYKCTTCPDFDLCTGCEAKGLHREHVMMRYAEPAQRREHMGKGFGRPVRVRCVGPPFGGPPAGPPGPFGGPSGCPMGAGMGPGTCGGGPGMGRGRFGMRGGRCGMGTGGGRGFGMGPCGFRGRRQFFRRMMHAAMAEQSDSSSEEESTTKDGKTQEGEGLLKEQCEMKKNQCCRGERRKWYRKMMRAMAEQSSSSEDEPAAKEAKADEATTEKEAEAQQQGACPEKEGCCQKKDGSCKKQCHKGKCMKKGFPKGVDVGLMMAAMMDPLDLENSDSQESEGGRCHRRRGGPWGGPWRQWGGRGCRRGRRAREEGEAQMDTAGDGEKTGGDGGAASGWTVVTALHGSDPADSEARIQHALEQMKSMGYSDEGGWLKSLLIAKNGDISQVLDTLNPSRGPEGEGPSN